MTHDRSLELSRLSTDAPNHEVADDNVSEAQDLLQQSSPGHNSLTYTEGRNLGLLFLLYFFHAIPLSFGWAAMPVLLSEQLSYSDIGTFLVSQYPYSLKVIWSPIVETLHVPALGRRKTWIVPCFLVVGTVLLWLALVQDRAIHRIQGGETGAMGMLVLAWLVIMTMCANIRISVDSWALELLSQPNVHWASSVASVGELASLFVSVQLFLGLSSLARKNNPDAASDGSTARAPSSTRAFFHIISLLVVVFSLSVAVLKREPTGSHKNSVRLVRQTYRIIWRILGLPQVWILILVHITSMIGFQTNDSITLLQYIRLEIFSERSLALLATISLPLEAFASIYVSRLFRTQHPLDVWRKIFPWRLGAAFAAQLGMLTLSIIQAALGQGAVEIWRWVIAVPTYCVSKFFEWSTYTAIIAFHAKISDPRYGGIYMSLLATSVNIRYDLLQFVYTKTIGWIDGRADATDPSGRHVRVRDGVKSYVDGYQIVNLGSVLIAIPMFVYFIRPATIWLQGRDVKAWRVVSGTQALNKEVETRLVDDDADDREHR